MERDTQDVSGSHARPRETAVEAQRSSLPLKGRSRILYIAAASPVPSKIGPARRNFHIIDQLSRFYDVSVLSLGSACDAAMFSVEMGNRVPVSRFAPVRPGSRRKFARKVWRTLTNRCDFLPALEPQLQRECANITTIGCFEAIVLSTVMLSSLPLPEGVPVIGDTHNVDFDVLRRMSRSADSWLRRIHASAQWQATRRTERRGAHRVSLLLTTSVRDREVFQRELDVSNVAVIPNGIDLTEFRFAEGPGEPGVILFSGLMAYYPNQQAVRWFLDHVFPSVQRRYPTATFVVAGAAPPRWLRARACERVHVTGLVTDMRPYFARASVVVAPLFVAGGTRVKILEAQAMGRPVVATSMGAEGLDARHGESILLADSPTNFADGVVQLLADPLLAARLAMEGRRHVSQRYDWNRIGEQLGTLLHTRLGLEPRDRCSTP